MMIRVLVLQSVRLKPGPGGIIWRGDQLDLDDRDAKRWIARGYVMAIGIPSGLVPDGPVGLNAARDSMLEGTQEPTIEGARDRAPSDATTDPQTGRRQQPRSQRSRA